MKSEDWKLIRRTKEQPIPKGVYLYHYEAIGKERYKVLYFSQTKVYLLFVPGKSAQRFKTWDRLIQYATKFERDRYFSWPRMKGYGIPRYLSK